MPAFRVTYATLTADDNELQTAYTAAVEDVRGRLGQIHALRIGEDDRDGEEFTTYSPIDNSVAVGRFPAASEGDVDAAVTAAARAQQSWAAMPWRRRVEVLDRAADLISERSVRDGAALAWENGKSRLEAIGEVEEAADLIRYYTHAITEHGGFEVPMLRFSENEMTTDVMRPYGVWGVIAPFNYPSALVAGPAGAALVAGNAVIIKPSKIGSFSGHLVFDALVEAGVPRGVVNLVTGGAYTGEVLVRHPGVDGLTFTGSSAVGMSILRTFSSVYPKPAICEMGGKNPVVVTAAADLDLAATGTARSAFSYAGQKCSAASRVFVEASVADSFIAKLVDRAVAIPHVGPLEPDGFLSPVVNGAALARYAAVVVSVGGAGEVLCGGRRLTDGALAAGNFVAPTVVLAPDDSPVWCDELFVPLIAVRPVASLDEALQQANGVPSGLTAGLFSEDEAEIERFLGAIEAGVVYVNRAAGATTGAWPGVQPFGGWKGSGTAGKAGGGPYYLQQYLREQSRTVVTSD